MDLHNDAVKALEFPPKEDKRDFGNLDEERSTKEEDILASLLEDFGMDDMWTDNEMSNQFHYVYQTVYSL